MQASDVIDLLFSALRNCKDPRINDVTADNYSDSAELILTTDDGQRQCFVISSSNITETEAPGL